MQILSKEKLQKVAGAVLIVDAGILLVHPKLIHTPFFDFGRLVRLLIGVWLISGKPVFSGQSVNLRGRFAIPMGCLGRN